MRAREFTLKEVGVTRRTFKGSPCTKDCSGHTAGYRWADKYNVADPNRCNSRSPKSFVKGCKIKGTEEKLKRSPPPTSP